MRSGMSYKSVWFAGAAVLLAALPSFAGKKKEDLSNMIIQGENRLRVEPRVPPVEWDPAPYQDVKGTLQDTTLLDNLTPPTISEPPVVLPEKTDSQKTASPWLERIYGPPVLRIEFKPAEEISKSAAEWAFIVKDSHGETFYEVKGKKNLPPEMVWEGFSNKNEAIHVGDDYSYSFSIVDEAGNPHRHAGKPFRVDTFRYKKGGGELTMFDPDVLFDGKSSLKLSKSGRDYLDEVRDRLRRKYGAQMEIVCYDQDPKFAEFRARAVRERLMQSLDIPDALIEAKGMPLSKGGDYRHVDILAK
jgi:hypothetical protein